MAEIVSLAEVRQKREANASADGQKRLQIAQLLIEICQDVGVPVQPELRAAVARAKKRPGH